MKESRNRGVHLPEAYWRELRRLAEEEERSLNSVLRQAVRQFLAKHQRREAERD